jgi:hypothetical protein
MLIFSRHPREEIVFPNSGIRIRREERWRGLKVFPVSGSDPADLGVSVGGAGVDAWSHKPLNTTRLQEVLRQGLGAASAAR